ncbi:unnamed protein product [Heterobilharzia americana]|nr:unnamed protein product [Heterobilharzia americana]
MIWRISLVFGVLLCSSYTIIVHLCEKDGKLPFSSFAVILMIELTKLLLSIIMFTYEIYQSDFNNDSFKCVSLKQTIYQEFYPTTLLENTSSVSAIPPLEYKQIIITIFPYTIPAVLYAFNNNLGLHIQLEMDPATYQILSNFKILSTAVLFRLIIKQRITPIQWFALLLLLTAGIVHSLGNFDTQKAFIPSSLSTTSKNNVSSVIHQVSSSIRITTKGVIMVSIYCTISGLSGVYTEHVMKKHATMNIHLQNFLLYTFGSILNGIVFILKNIKKMFQMTVFIYFEVSII